MGTFFFNSCVPSQAVAIVPYMTMNKCTHYIMWPLNNLLNFSFQTDWKFLSYGIILAQSEVHSSYKEVHGLEGFFLSIFFLF